MTEPTIKITDEEKMLLLVNKLMESGKGFGFLLDLMNDKKSQVHFKIEIEMTRMPAKE